MTVIDEGRWLLASDPDQCENFLAGLRETKRCKLLKFWPIWARPEQLPPDGEWRIWLICAGRGFGKTRAGAEWVRHIATSHPAARIALVSASLTEARAVMVEGESGILACHDKDERPDFEPSLRRLTWRSGAQATLYSAAEAESLRGPQHSHARRSGPKGIFRKRSSLQSRFPPPPRHRRRD